jgi:hypothetical protein
MSSVMSAISTLEPSPSPGREGRPVRKPKTQIEKRTWGTLLILPCQQIRLPSTRAAVRFSKSFFESRPVLATNREASLQLSISFSSCHSSIRREAKYIKSMMATYPYSYPFEQGPRFFPGEE